MLDDIVDGTGYRCRHSYLQSMNTSAPFTCSTATAIAPCPNRQHSSLTQASTTSGLCSSSLSHLPLRRTGRLQAPHMLLIGPVDAYERHELRLLLDRFPGCHSFLILLVLVAFTSGRGWLCFREALIVEPSLRRCSGLHLSIRLGSKARPAVRDSDLEHRVLGD